MWQPCFQRSDSLTCLLFIALEIINNVGQAIRAAPQKREFRNT